MVEVYPDSGSGGVARAGLVGHPVAHSLSPRIHGHWLHAYAIQGAYEAHDVPPDALPAAVAGFQARGWRGVNVTLPHKRSVMALCTSLSDEAEKIGAVNTLVFQADGGIEGRNTDAHGFLANAAEAWPGFDPAAGPAVVLGAGGAARAILYALRQKGCRDIRVVNRHAARAEQLADEFGARAIAWDARDAALGGARCLVNATSLGMTGEPALTIDLRGLDPRALVYDIVYAPMMTDLLHAAQARDLAVVTGIGMLLHQAKPAFEAFFGQSPAVTAELRRAVSA